MFASMPPSRLLPDCFSYAAVATACARSGQWQMALLCWQDMASRGVELSEVAWNAVITACERGGQWQLALSLFSALP